jgi:hypothetical protein
MLVGLIGRAKPIPADAWAVHQERMWVTGAAVVGAHRASPVVPIFRPVRFSFVLCRQLCAEVAAGALECVSRHAGREGDGTRGHGDSRGSAWAKVTGFAEDERVAA